MNQVNEAQKASFFFLQKPFEKDLDSAAGQFAAQLRELCEKNQLYRIDHYRFFSAS